MAETIVRPGRRSAGSESPVADSAKDELPAPSAEIRALLAVQRTAGHRQILTAAKAMSHFGEHAAGWIALGLLGTVVDRHRRREWLAATVGVAAAHGAAIGVKRIVRRQRPDDPRVQVHAGTPSQLSFPSAHATSTTAAAMLFGRLLGKRLGPLLVPPMALSRLVLGVHYPTDVLAGSALGALVAVVSSRSSRRRRENTR